MTRTRLISVSIIFLASILAAALFHLVLEHYVNAETAPIQSVEQRIATSLEKIADTAGQASDRWLRDISDKLERISQELYNIRRELEQIR